MNAYHNFAMLPRTSVDALQSPVSGRVSLFSIPYACVAAGIPCLRKPPVMGYQSEWDRSAGRPWKHSMQSFFNALKKAGIDIQKALVPHARVPNYLIGFSDPDTLNNLDARGLLGICPDLSLTLSVLARRVGDLYLAGRQPEPTCERLFEAPLCFDLPGYRLPTLREEPWISILT